MQRRNLVAVLVTPVLVLTAAASPASAGPRVGDFRADLAPLNQDGQGLVTLNQLGTQLTVHLEAAGLHDGVHVAHIHGLRQAQNECPTLAADSDGNGVVDFAEGLPAYGPVQRTLSNGTNDRGTSLDYTRSSPTSTPVTRSPPSAVSTSTRSSCTASTSAATVRQPTLTSTATVQTPTTTRSRCRRCAGPSGPPGSTARPERRR